MFLYYNLLSIYNKRGLPQNIYKRIIRNSSDKSGKGYKITMKAEKEPKFVSVKKSIVPDKHHVSVVERKRASSVIKRLNWENNHLFGPIQSAHSDTYQVRNIEESNKIIQHSTEIPIIEPVISYSEIAEESCERKQLPNLETILSFPLVNKSVFEPDNIREQINKMNVLRKYIETFSNSSIPSVSRILEKTMPEDRIEHLNRWKQNMINELGEEGFQKYQKDLLANGASLHNYINSFLASTPEELQIKAENIGHWKSLKHVFPHIQDVKLIEEYVTHPFLRYTGVVDCFAKYKDHLVVIDWKTSKKAKLNIKSTFDNPLQIAAYIGALNFDPKYQYLVSKGLVVVAYDNGSPATVHFIDEYATKEYWKEWLQRVKQFWEMKSSEKGKS